MSSVLSASMIREYLISSPPLLEGLIDPDIQIQPNGVDLSLRSVQRFSTQGHLDFSNRERVLAQVSDIEFQDEWLELAPGPYLVMFNDIVHLPSHIMAIGRPRSSLLRMGATVETAVWDAGYNGRSQSLLVVHNRDGIRLAQNARLIQLVFFAMEGRTESYAGIYQRENI
jgi:dUTP pyrophosphatase